METTRYPKRALSHVKETESFRRLEQTIPSDWLVRHVTERDYGLDCLIEIVVDDTLQGNLMAIQVKGTSRLKWAERPNGNSPATTFSGTKVETVNYWMGLPIPVFLCLYERTSRKIFFTDVQRQVRRRFMQLKTQKTFGFELWPDFELTHQTGPLVLAGLYVRERNFNHFTEALLDLIAHADSYAEYIGINVSRDCFFEVEPDDLAPMIRLYRNCQVVATFLGMTWTPTSLGELFTEDRKYFPNSGAWLHEYGRGKCLWEVTPYFVEALRKGARLVSEIERDYWQRRDPFLVLCTEDDALNVRIHNIANQFKHIGPDP